MTTIIPTPIPGLPAAPRTASASPAGAFTSLLQLNLGTSNPLPRPTDLASLASYLQSDAGATLTQDIETMAKNAMDKVNTQLQTLFKAQNIANSPPIIIEIEKNGQISVSDNPEKAKILQILNNTPELVHAIRQAAALQERAALLEQYEEYLKAYRKAYAEGGPSAAQEVTDRYLLLSAKFSYQFDDIKGVTVRVNGQLIKNWLGDTAQALSKN